MDNVKKKTRPNDNQVKQANIDEQIQLINDWDEDI